MILYIASCIGICNYIISYHVLEPSKWKIRWEFQTSVLQGDLFPPRPLNLSEKLERKMVHNSLVIAKNERELVIAMIPKSNLLSVRFQSYQRKLQTSSLTPSHYDSYILTKCNQALMRNSWSHDYRNCEIERKAYKSAKFTSRWQLFVELPSCYA